MAFTLVQSTNQSSFVATPVSQAFGSNNAAGNLLVAFFNTPAGVGSLAISDTQTNTWVQLDVQAAPAGIQCVVYYCLSSKAGANTPQLSWTGGGTSSIMLAEFSPGVTSTTTFDTKNKGNGNSTTFSAGSITPAAANELLILAASWTGSGKICTAGSGFTVLNSNNAFENAEYNLSGSSGAQTPTMTVPAAAVNYGAIVAAFSAISTATTTDVISSGIPKPCVLYGRSPSGILSAVTTDGSGNINRSGSTSSVDTVNNAVPAPIMLYGRAPNGQLQAVTTDGNGKLNG